MCSTRGLPAEKGTWSSTPCSPSPLRASAAWDTALASLPGPCWASLPGPRLARTLREYMALPPAQPGSMVGLIKRHSAAQGAPGGGKRVLSCCAPLLRLASRNGR